MQRLEVSGAVRPIYGSLGVKRLGGQTWDRIQGDLSYCIPQIAMTLKSCNFLLFLVNY